MGLFMSKAQDIPTLDEMGTSPACSDARTARECQATSSRVGVATRRNQRNAPNPQDSHDAPIPPLSAPKLWRRSFPQINK